MLDKELSRLVQVGEHLKQMFYNGVAVLFNFCARRMIVPLKTGKLWLILLLKTLSKNLKLRLNH
jgi:hypothetical protein